MADVKTLSYEKIPGEFRNAWNHAVSDHKITSEEYKSLELLAGSTGSNVDNEFIRDLKDAASFGKMRLSSDGYDKSTAGKDRLDRFIDAAKEAGLEVDDFELTIENENGLTQKLNLYRSSSITSSFDLTPDFMVKKDDAEKKGGIGGVAIGYQVMDYSKAGQVTGHVHGIHADASFYHSAVSLGFVTPAIKLEANTGFGDGSVVLDGGAGANLHFFLPGLLQCYSGVMAHGSVSRVNTQDATGWSANPVVGGQLLILYYEHTFEPLTGSAVQRGSGDSFGLRIGF